MISFITDSIKELRHVTWTTRKETQKYFIVVLVILISFGLYLFIANASITAILFSLRDTLFSY